MAILLRNLDYVGLEIDLRFTIGQYLDIPLEVVNEDGDPVNISGRIYTCEIGPEGEAGTHQFTQVPNEALLGLVNIHLDTTGMTSGHFKWIAWEDIGGIKNQLWQGSVEAINPVVT